MGRSFSAYERELKELLQGEPEAIGRYGRALSDGDRAILRSIARAPFLVVRAAGSLGFDLVALRSEFAFPLEVKASSSSTIRFSAASGRSVAQLRAHREAVDRVGLILIYAFRRLGNRTGDRWRLYAAETSASRGSAGLLKRWLPPIGSTRDGNGVLRWEAGMPLLRFLERIAFLTAPAERPA